MKKKEYTIVKSKDIICPKCQRKEKLDIIEYKISLQNIKGHNLENILLNEYNNTKNMVQTKIICEACEKENKALSYKNIFYKSIQCEINLCVKCQTK